MLVLALKVLVWVSGGILAASFGGGLHPLGDSLAVFRPILTGGLIVVCAMVWRWRIAQFFMAISLVLGVWQGAQLLPHTGPETTDITLYQKNMLFRPADRTAFLQDLRNVSADFVTLQEVSRANAWILQELVDLYPHHLLCNGHSVGAVAILSKTPLTIRDCGTRPGFARAVSMLHGQPVQIYALHLHWPWPYGQADHLASLLPDLVPLRDGHTLVGGDFNMVAASTTLRRIEQATQTDRVGRHVRTFSLRGYPLGIDHVLATGGQGRLDVRPLMGSDHHGIVAQIGLSRP